MLHVRCDARKIRAPPSVSTSPPPPLTPYSMAATSADGLTLRSWSHCRSVPNPVHSRLDDIGPRLRPHHHVVAMDHWSWKRHTTSRQNRRCYHFRLWLRFRFQLSCLRFRFRCIWLRSATDSQESHQGCYHTDDGTGRCACIVRRSIEHLLRVGWMSAAVNWSLVKCGAEDRHFTLSV